MVEWDEKDTDPTGILLFPQSPAVPATEDFLAKGAQQIYKLEKHHKVSVYSRTQKEHVEAKVYAISTDGTLVEVRYRHSNLGKVVKNDETIPPMYLGIDVPKEQKAAPPKPPEAPSDKPQRVEVATGGLRAYFRGVWNWILREK